MQWTDAADEALKAAAWTVAVPVARWLGEDAGRDALAEAGFVMVRLAEDYTREDGEAVVSVWQVRRAAVGYGGYRPSLWRRIRGIPHTIAALITSKARVA